MKTVEYQKLTEQTISIVREVGGFIRREYGKVGDRDIVEKDHNMLVSYVDEEAEDSLIAQLAELVPKPGFLAEGEGGGAYLNKQPIQVRQSKNLEESLIATGFPYHDYKRMEAYIDVLKQLMRRSRGIRRMGSAATDLAYVAAGRFDAFFEYSLSPWDVAAGSIIAREAGAHVCDFSGHSDYIFGKEAFGKQ